MGRASAVSASSVRFARDPERLQLNLTLPSMLKVARDIPRIPEPRPRCPDVAHAYTKACGCAARKEAVIEDVPIDALVSNVVTHIPWKTTAFLAMTCSGLRRATHSHSKIARILVRKLRFWRAAARSIRTEWQVFAEWRLEASRLREEAMDANMTKELEDMMSEEECCADLTDEEADFIEDQMMKQSWEHCVQRLVSSARMSACKHLLFSCNEARDQ